jgi:hypothetical protein
MKRVWQKINFRFGETAFLGVSVLIVAVTRWLTRSHLLYHWDSVQFALGAKDFNIALHQPHPPGYIFYTYLVKGLDYLTLDPGLSMVLISIAASVLTLLAVYQLARELLGVRVAVLTTLLLLADRLFWFHGSVNLNYSVEMLLSTLAALLAWRFIVRKDFLDLACMTLVVGLAGGFRLSVELFLFPLWLYTASRGGWRTLIKSGLLLLVATAAWLVPTLLSLGGLKEGMVFLTTSTGKVLQDFDAHYSSIGSNPFVTLFNNLKSILYILWQSLNLGLFLLVVGIGFPGVSQRISEARSRQLLSFELLWALPPLAFFLLVFFFNPGYLLVFYPLVIIALAVSLIRLGEVLQELVGEEAANWTKLFFVAIFTISASGFVLISPQSVKALSLSFGEIRIADHQIELFKAIVEQNLDPQDTLILVEGDFFHLGYRHIAYYLPDFKVCARVSLALFDGTHYLRCSQNGVEQYVSEIELTGVDNVLVRRNGWPEITHVVGAYLGPHQFVSWYDLASEEGKAFLSSEGKAYHLK